ncbi:unnamed protein product [Oppiella nova]|uniref:HIT domain-containing protein n=1 Tax=Oppiella nova TaxID=334625 RepID=A0A7R9QXX7_9ACAR|nr:unnamed protein product [Oppiella nova]CAG2179681.1 unnamed protein product [Oppiella nova]
MKDFNRFSSEIMCLSLPPITSIIDMDSHIASDSPLNDHWDVQQMMVMTAMKRHSTDTRVEAKRASNWWTNGLLSAMKDQSLVVLKDDLITIIEDKYPKSRHHLLVIPNKNSGMDSVDDLTASDVQLIDHMTLKGKQISQQFDGSVEFRFGFHRIPSLKPLHLHVISQDFDSKYLKTKKHYNSFTTKFFIDSKSNVHLF